MHSKDLKRLIKALKPITYEENLRYPAEVFLSTVIRPFCTHESQTRLIDAFIEEIRNGLTNPGSLSPIKPLDKKMLETALTILGQVLFKLAEHELAEEALKLIRELLSNL